MQLNTGFPEMFPKSGEKYIVAFQFQQHWTLNKFIFVHFSRCILFSLGYIC